MPDQSPCNKHNVTPQGKELGGRGDRWGRLSHSWVSKESVEQCVFFPVVELRLSNYMK